MLGNMYRILWSLLGRAYRLSNRNKLVYRMAMYVMDAWCKNDIENINKHGDY